MQVQAGERTRVTGTFTCTLCKYEVSLVHGETVPRCPQCSNDTFEEPPTLADPR